MGHPLQMVHQIAEVTHIKYLTHGVPLNALRFFSFFFFFRVVLCCVLALLSVRCWSLCCAVLCVDHVQFLQQQYATLGTSCGGRLSGPPAAWASGCSSERGVHGTTNASQLAASATRRTLGRQPAAELPHPDHRPH